LIGFEKTRPHEELEHVNVSSVFAVPRVCSFLFAIVILVLEEESAAYSIDEASISIPNNKKSGEPVNIEMD
jgi:hypothetical protein